MRRFIIYFCCLTLLSALNPHSPFQINFDSLQSPFPRFEARFRTFQYCILKDYPVQQHLIHTTDGYNLVFYRIQAKNSTIKENRIPIYLQHGLVDSSDTWIVNDQNLAPAFYFANKGYDVWLGNTRGNRYSSPKQSPKIKNFWNFSFDQMAQYDLPAALRYIYKVTKRQIHYIGHSQGTLIMFIALAQRYADVEEYLASFSAFGPVAYIKNQNSHPSGFLSKVDLPKVLMKLNVKKFLFSSDSVKLTIAKLCYVSPSVCIEGLKAISQQNVTVDNLKRLPVIMGHFPSGSSVKNFQHFSQFIRVDKFRKYDYGKKLNQIHYNQPEPPLYDLSKITFPVHLFVGKYDKLADKADAQRLFTELNNSVGKTTKLYDFGHATFIWGKTNVHLDDALAIIQKAEITNTITNNQAIDEIVRETSTSYDRI